MQWIVILGIAWALAAGCESNNGDGTSGGSLAGTKWRLTAWSAGSSDPSRYTITADFSESRISGTSAVNSYGGPYTATADGSFSVGDLQATLMGGPEEAMRAEDIYFDLLGQARKYASTPTMLTLKDRDDQDILIFNAR
jgi:heat shock protein HslJ